MRLIAEEISKAWDAMPSPGETTAEDIAIKTIACDMHLALSSIATSLERIAASVAAQSPGVSGPTATTFHVDV